MDGYILCRVEYSTLATCRGGGSQLSITAEYCFSTDLFCTKIFWARGNRTRSSICTLGMMPCNAMQCHAMQCTEGQHSADLPSPSLQVALLALLLQLYCAVQFIFPHSAGAVCCGELSELLGGHATRNLLLLPESSTLHARIQEGNLFSHPSHAACLWLLCLVVKRLRHQVTRSARYLYLKFY